MKAVKYLYSCMLVISLGACIKSNDGVKATLETTLPTIEVTSLGLLRQTGPFATSDAIQVTFGGAITKAEPATFDVAWYDAPSSGAATMIDSTHFESWNELASAATANNAITTNFIPTTYPNTRSFSGNLVLKLSKLPGGSKAYTLRVYARTKSDKTGTVAVTKFVTIK